MNDYRNILNPFVLHWMEISELIDRMGDSELDDLLKACDKPTSTNCWYIVYEIANVLRPYVQKTIDRRMFALQGKCGESEFAREEIE